MTEMRNLILMLCALAGCAARPPVTQSRDMGARVSLQVQAIPAGAQGFRAVGLGDTLHSGDRLALSITVDRPAYVYVAKLQRDGGVELLLPREGEAPVLVQPGAPLQVPAAGGWIRLDEDVGVEDLFVLASAQPVPLADVKEQAKRPPEEKKPPQPQQPPVMGERDRGYNKDKKTLWALLGKRGKAVLRFSFRHE